MAILTAAAGAVAWQLLRRGAGRRRCRLRVRQSLLPPGRRYLYSRLTEAVGEDVTIQVAVRLGEVAMPTASSGKGRAWWEKAAEMPLDFVLCGARDLAPQLVILLEDPAAPSHRTRRQLKRWVQQAGLPCLVLAGEREYEVEELEGVIGPRRAA